MRSVLAQTLHVAEIIVVDDGSLDDSADIAVRVDSRVKVLRQNNHGVGMARQKGFDSTTAEFVMFLDADDVLHANALEKLAGILETNPDVALVCARAEIWFPGEPVPLRKDALSWPEGDLIWAGLLFGNCIRTPGCALVRREALVRSGGWDSHPSLKGNEDWDLWLRLAERERFHNLPEPLIQYRQHAGAYSRNKLVMFRGMRAVLKKQRERHQSDARRLRLVTDAEWNGCYQFNRMALVAFREQVSRGQIFTALKTAAEIATTSFRPFLVRLLTIPRRRWR